MYPLWICYCWSNWQSSKGIHTTKPNYKCFFYISTSLSFLCFWFNWCYHGSLILIWLSRFSLVFFLFVNGFGTFIFHFIAHFFVFVYPCLLYISSIWFSLSLALIGTCLSSDLFYILLFRLDDQKWPHMSWPPLWVLYSHTFWKGSCWRIDNELLADLFVPPIHSRTKTDDTFINFLFFIFIITISYLIHFIPFTLHLFNLSLT